MSLDIQPLTGSIGAEIFGVDISRPLSAQLAGEIRAALLGHLVIFFRDQSLDVAQHKAFARAFGEIFIHPYLELGSDPEIIEIRRKPGDARVTGDHWHSDTTMAPEPPMGSILYGVTIPPYGGDTLFANQYLAYESLSEIMKGRLDGLKALHSDRLIVAPSLQNTYNQDRSTKARENKEYRETLSRHPLVRTHPETGRKALFVNRAQTVGIDGMADDESRPLLEYLFEHGNRPEFSCRFRWREGSVAFWDNRCTKHYAVNDTGAFERVMRRIQLRGDAPF